MKRRLPLVAVALWALVSAAPADAATEQVEMDDNVFRPRTMTVTAGDSVRWENVGDNPHTVTGDGMDSGSVAPGEEYSYRFNSAGTFDYVCDFHPGMDGSVVVRAAAATTGGDDDDDEVSGGGLARTGSAEQAARAGAAFAFVALGAWLMDLERIRSARHRAR